MSTKNCSEEIHSLFLQKFQDRVCFNEKLAPYLAYQIGGPADILIFPKNEEELLWIQEQRKRFSLPIHLIGNGTNLIVRDGGIRGITLSLLHSFQEISIQKKQENGSVLVRVGGGVSKETLLHWAMQNSYAGLVFSAGVPGTIGGGIYMNAGTKYGCYGDLLERIRLFDFETGKAIEKQREEVEFGYREQTAVKNSLVLWAEFLLFPGNTKELQEEVTRIKKERAEKQPLEAPSCGSTFKNPPPPHPAAGRLIEKAGLKGLSVGGAKVSEKHGNFLLNQGNATAKDLISLIEIIQKKVYEEFKVQLELEVILLGED